MFDVHGLLWALLLGISNKREIRNADGARDTGPARPGSGTSPHSRERREPTGKAGPPFVRVRDRIFSEPRC